MCHPRCCPRGNQDCPREQSARSVLTPRDRGWGGRARRVQPYTNHTSLTASQASGNHKHHFSTKTTDGPERRNTSPKQPGTFPSFLRRGPRPYLKRRHRVCLHVEAGVASLIQGPVVRLLERGQRGDTVLPTDGRGAGFTCPFPKGSWPLSLLFSLTPGPAQSPDLSGDGCRGWPHPCLSRP